jgi:gliding motility-associated-like protein
MWWCRPYVLLLLSFPLALLAQPVNNDCTGAIQLPDVTNWCSEFAAYTNVGATPSGYGPPTCSTVGAQNDVWFRFVAEATDITIIVNGNSGQGAGGTMLNPRVALYAGTCGGIINQLECGSGVGVNIIEAYQGGLTPGPTYWIRVTSFTPTGGTFQLCLNNYNSPVEATSDCPTAAILCDKSPFVVPSVIGAGIDATELDDATCFSNGAPVNHETNSSWFTWICETAGTLTFTLTPNRPSDDLDFVVYELPNGIGNCAGKIMLRCMASGDFTFPSRCMGPTGLRLGENDISEPAGCALASQNNWLAPLLMVPGRTYALAVNNFSSTGNGFGVEFGGTGTFRGPDADFLTLPPKDTYCIAEPIAFQDASSFVLGSITGQTWYFGLDAVPSTATGPGLHSVKYGSAGVKTIALVVETDLGCQVTTTRTLVIEPCCDGLNAMNVNAVVTDLDCFGDADGTIDLTVSSITTVGFNWDDGTIMPDRDMLPAGIYTVTITNEATCDTVISFEITSPPPLEGEPQVTSPTCDGGQDGAILLQTSGGVPPYQYDWQDGQGFVSNNSRSGLPVGLYIVTIRDANDCERQLAVDVRELELLLNPALHAVSEPSCFGAADGVITLQVINGLPPYQYNFNGGGWSSLSTYTGLAAGTYVVEVRDANNCRGLFTFQVGQPDPLEPALLPRNISCFGLADGQIEATVTGGTPPYSFQWSNQQSGPLASGLSPGNYNLTVTDARGCTALAGTTLQEPPELFLFEGEILGVRCFGEANGAVSVSAAGGSPGFQFSLEGGPYQDDPSFSGLRAGSYLLTVRDAAGCTASLILQVDQPLPLLVDAGPDVTIDLGESAGLNAVVSPAFTPVILLWEPSGSLDRPDHPSVIAAPVTTTVYTVTVEDERGCIARDMVTVVVRKIRDIYIPNAFSPDNNGINDLFTIYGGKAAESILELRIYNRWGGLVYEGKFLPLNDETVGWNGQFRGRPLDPEVFAFYALIRFIDGEEIIYKGDIQLIR